MRIYSKDYQRGIKIDQTKIDFARLYGANGGVLPYDTGVGEPMCSGPVTEVTEAGAKAFIERERAK